MNPVVLIVLLFTLPLWVLLWQYLSSRKKKKLAPPQAYDSTLAKELEFDFIHFHPLVPFNSKRKNLEAQGPEWVRRMHQNGFQMATAGVKKVYFIHGTFVGEDPLDVFRVVGNAYPSLDQAFLRPMFKKIKDTFLIDTGNFHEDYLKLFKNAIGNSIDVDAFHWSSANHHLARVQGAARLMTQIADDEDHLLLVGHSHAGQLFSIITQILNNVESTAILKDVLSQSGHLPLNFDELIKKIKRKNLDFVTLGTPPRYSWCLNSKIRLLHLVNHRGEDHLAGKLSGILNTRDGDYIQQLGIAGSDIQAVSKLDRELNKTLDSALGVGSDLRYWREAITYRKRIHDSGKTLLVDYRDSGMIPNAHKTIFGHANYTRFNVMLFNTTQISKNLY